MQGKAIGEHGDGRKSEQISKDGGGVRSDVGPQRKAYSAEDGAKTKIVEEDMPSSKDGEVRTAAGLQRRAYSSSEEEDSTKKVGKHMLSSTEEEARSAASKSKGAHLTSNSRKKCRVSKPDAVPRISNRKPKPFGSVEEEGGTASLKSKGAHLTSKSGKKCGMPESDLKILRLLAKMFDKPKRGDTAEGAEKQKFYYYKNSKYTKEELKKRWGERVPLHREDKPFTRECCEAALKYYYEKHRVEFMLVKPGMIKEMWVGPAHFVYHVNFKAKKPNDDDRDAVLFFAELELHVPCSDPPRGVVCTILDANTEIQKECERCYPGWILHPADGFKFCRGSFEHKEDDTTEYVSSPGELRSDGDSASVC